MISSGVYVPIGGKKLLTFMDDFNMPAKDTFGSQPPLELMKMWMDYSFWYDRLKQTTKYIKVGVKASNKPPKCFKVVFLEGFFFLGGGERAKLEGLTFRSVQDLQRQTET